MPVFCSDSSFEVFKTSVLKKLDSNVNTIISFLKDDIKKIDALSSLASSSIQDPSSTLSVGSYDPALSTKRLILKNGKGEEIDIHQWISDTMSLTDPRYEESIEETLAHLV